MRIPRCCGYNTIVWLAYDCSKIVHVSVDTCEFQIYYCMQELKAGVVFTVLLFNSWLVTISCHTTYSIEGAACCYKAQFDEYSIAY